MARAFHAASSYYAGPGTILMGDGEDAIWQQDLSIEPRPSKLYENLAPIPLRKDLGRTTLPALDAIARSGSEGGGHPTLAALARLGLLSNGLLNRQQRRRTGSVAEFRTAGATGARYHLELYFACRDLADLPAGVYHYTTDDHSLRQLRAGDYRAPVLEASADEPALVGAPVILALTTTFWRNAWRYKARAYRHAYWDAGTLLANFLAVAASLDLATRLVLGFAEAQVNRVLGIDGQRENTLALCAVGRGAPPAPRLGEVEAIKHRTRPVSTSEVTFEHIPRMVAASTLHTREEVVAWRQHPLRRPIEPPAQAPIPLSVSAEVPSAPIEDVILARRSTRNYDVQQSITFEAFSTVLDRSSRGFATDALAADALPLHANYLIVNGVAGLDSGVYLHRVHERAVELLRAGDFREQARRLAGFQQYAGDAHVNSYYLANLESVLDSYGNRGYGLAQLEAALYAGRLHLAAHAVGLRAVGSTSLDAEVVEFFSPRAASSSYLFVTVFGLRRRRSV